MRPTKQSKTLVLAQKSFDVVPAIDKYLSLFFVTILILCDFLSAARLVFAKALLYDNVHSQHSSLPSTYKNTI